jgi:hypothetical protein
MTASEHTLKQVKATAQARDRVVRVSDFLTNEQKIELKLAQEERAIRKNRGFDDVDAISAEILARFGWSAWSAWQNGQIPENRIYRMMLAERARWKRELLGIEGIILASIAGANNPTKHGHAPKSLKNAIKIFKSEQKQAKGALNG